MKTVKHILLGALLLAALCACGRGKSAEKASAPASLPTRVFPRVQPPQLHPDGPAIYTVDHFWDAYFKDVNQYRTDSLYLGGVEKIQLEEAYGLYATLLWNVPLETAKASTGRLYDQLVAAKNGKVAEALVDLTSRYLYDPNSPVRCEDFYLPFVEKLAEGDLAPEDMQMQYGFQARMCAMNAMGTPAADFSFTDTRGRRRTLYGIEADYILLIFGNPDCTACKELVVDMENSPAVAEMSDSGRLKVVDIFIDREVDQWKARVASYPAQWINGYDHSFTIRDDILYNVRAVPSMYLLDKDKRVIFKDVPPEILLTYLSMVS